MTATAQPLYTIADELSAIIEQIQESGGVLTPDIEAAFDALSGTFREKVGRCLAHIRNLDALTEARLAEARRLRESAESAGKAAMRLKEYVLTQMERVGERKVETDLGSARIQQNSRPSIEWPGDAQTIPAAFQKWEIRLDGTAAYEAWKAKSLPEGFVVETGRHLRIT